MRSSVFSAKLLQCLVNADADGCSVGLGRLWHDVGIPLHRGQEVVFGEMKKLIVKGWVQLCDEEYSITQKGKLALASFKIQHPNVFAGGC